MWLHLLPSHQDTRITRQPSCFVMETSLINCINPIVGLDCGSRPLYSVHFPFFTKQAALGQEMCRLHAAQTANISLRNHHQQQLQKHREHIPGPLTTSMSHHLSPYNWINFLEACYRLYGWIQSKILQHCVASATKCVKR